MAVRVRTLTSEEEQQITRRSQSRTESARAVERARIVRLATEGLLVPAIAQRLQIAEKVVRLWLKRFNASGLAGLEDQARSGRPATYTPEQVGTMIATALTNPHDLQQPFGSWTFERLAVYLNESCGIAVKRSRLHEILHAEGLRWRQQETWFGARVDPDFAQKRGGLSSSTLSPQQAAS